MQPPTVLGQPAPTAGCAHRRSTAPHSPVKPLREPLVGWSPFMRLGRADPEVGRRCLLFSTEEAHRV